MNREPCPCVPNRHVLASLLLAVVFLMVAVAVDAKGDRSVTRVAHDPTWPPIEFLNERVELSGMSGGSLNLMDLRFDNTLPWLARGVFAVIVLILCLWNWRLAREIANRKQAEAALRESEAQNRALLSAIPDLIFTNRRDGTFLAVQASDPSALYVPPGAFLNRRVEEVLPEPVAGQFLHAYAEALASGEVQEVTYTLPIDGQKRHFEARVVPTIEDKLISIVRDITERKQAEEALRKSEERYRAFVANSTEGIWRGEADEPIPTTLPVEEQVEQILQRAYIAECNDATARMYGLDRAEELIGIRWGELVTHDPRNVEFIRTFIQSGYRLVDAESLEMDREGTVHCFLNSMIGVVEDHHLIGAWGVQRDITERKRTEEALRQANLLVENSPVVLFRWRAAEGWPVDMVSHNVSQFGYAPGELLSGEVPFASMVHPEDLDRVGRELQDYAASGMDRFQQEYRIVTKDGGVRWVDDRTLVERNIHGQIAFYQGIVIDITERKRAELALRESEERLRLTVTAANQGLYDLNVQTGEATVSPEYATLLGYDPATFLETNAAWIERLHPDDRESVATAYRDYIAGKRALFQVEFRQRTAGGDWKWILSLGKVVEFDAAGHPLRMLGTHLDITERKQTEEALRTSEANLQLAFEAARLGDWSWDIGTGDVKWSARCKALYGLSPDTEVTYERFLERVHPEDRERVDAALKRALELKGDYDVEKRAIWPDGSVHWNATLGRVFCNADGHPVRMAGVTLDITERKRAEEDLHESMRRLQTVVNGAPVVLYSFDRHGVFTLSEGKGLVGLGIKPGEIVGRTIFEIYGDQPEAIDALRRALAGETFTLELSFPAGGTFEVSHIAMRDEAGGYAGTIGVLVDITERKRAEDTLRASLEEKESLLKEVHHRVKNNLQVISSLLKLQARKVKNPDAQGFLEDTQNRIHSMALLHETLYRSDNLAKVGFPQYVKNVCTHVARSYAPQAESIRLLHEIADVALDLDLAIPAGLIINELVSNAFKHAFPSRSAGEILVELQSAPEHRLVLRVSDNGVGFPAETDPQSAETLGLLLVRNLTRQLDGRMSVSSGQGTVFEIVFPIIQPL